MGSISQLVFRRATTRDASEILSLVRAAYRGQHPKGWTTEAHLVDDNRIELDEVIAKITAPNDYVLMIHRRTSDDAVNSGSSSEDSNSPINAGKVLACCELVRGTGEEENTCRFGLFAVDPAQQGGGVGKQVIAEAERVAREKMGATRMEMMVISVRDELISFYKRRGYALTGKLVPFKQGLSFAQLIKAL